jgi:hypothetical protein
MMEKLASTQVKQDCNLEIAVHLDSECKGWQVLESQENQAVETKLDCIQDCNHCQLGRMILQYLVSWHHLPVTMHHCMPECHHLAMVSSAENPCRC